MKNVYIGIFALFVVTSLVGIWFWDRATPRNNVATAAPRSVTFTQSEVMMHDTASDCWSTVNDTVYNLTSWIGLHPGGEEKIIAMCGKDASFAFDTQHGNQALPLSELKGFSIGILAK